MTEAKPLTAEELEAFRRSPVGETQRRLIATIDAQAAEMAALLAANRGAHLHFDVLKADYEALRTMNKRLQTLHDERDALSRKTDQDIERLLTENERLRAGAPDGWVLVPTADHLPDADPGCDVCEVIANMARVCGGGAIEIYRAILAAVPMAPTAPHSRTLNEYEYESLMAFDHETSLHPPAQPMPIDMILFCPKCGQQHVDAADERTLGWTNPPHRSHLCHGCGHIWRPADVATNGVAAIKTKGKADSPAVTLTHPVTVRVKPLSWEDDPSNCPTAGWSQVIGLVGKYDLHVDTRGFVQLWGADKSPLTFENRGEAEAEAQTHYERRIPSAIETAQIAK